MILRKMPTREEIQERATKRFFGDSLGSLPFITPTRGELSEGGHLQRARIELMTSEETEAKLQQRKYLDTMAQELKLRVIPKRDLTTLKRETGFEFVNGWKRPKKVAPKPRVKPQKRATRKRKAPIRPPTKKAVVKRRKKKLGKISNNRNGRRSRRWKQKKGTIFLPNSVWKAREPKRKRRKK